jgi:hypothetical protein
VQLLIYGVITPKSCPVAFGWNGALRDQKSRGRLPEHSVQGLEIVPIRQFHELAELRLDRVQSLRIQGLLITGWRGGHGACEKSVKAKAAARNIFCTIIILCAW